MAATKAVPRQDPVARPVDGRKNRDKVIGKRPGYRYMFAFRGHADTGEQKFLSLGWEHVRQPKQGEEGERLWRGDTVKPGEIIEESGHVLMRIEEAKWLQTIAEGDDSSIGQTGVDHIEAGIIDKTNGGAGMDDTMRGLARRYGGRLFVENETSVG